MKINKFLITTFFCFLGVFVVSADDVSGVINFKNGKKVECLIDNTTIFSDKVHYRLSPTSKKIKVKSEDLQNIVIADKDGEAYIVENVNYVNNYKKYLQRDLGKFKQRMCNVVEYGAVCLYCYSLIRYGNQGWIGTDNFYYCRKKNQDCAVRVGVVQVVPKFMSTKNTKTRTYFDNFDELYENLFGDYPELCQQIREGKFNKLIDIEAIVREYNEYKAQGEKKN